MWCLKAVFLDGFLKAKAAIIGVAVVMRAVIVVEAKAAIIGVEVMMRAVMVVAPLPQAKAAIIGVEVMMRAVMVVAPLPQAKAAIIGVEVMMRAVIVVEAMTKVLGTRVPGEIRELLSVTVHCSRTKKDTFAHTAVVL